MVLIEKPPGLGFRTAEAIIALDIQPHPLNDTKWKGVERLAAAAGNIVKIWSFSLVPFSTLGLEVFDKHQDAKNNHFSSKTLVMDGDPLPSEASDVVMSHERKKRRTNDLSSTSTTSPTQSCSRSSSPPPVSSIHLNDETSNCQCRSKCVAILTDHRLYLIGLRWSPTGHLLASCDSKQIMLWEFIGFSYSIATSEIDRQSTLIGSSLPSTIQNPRFNEKTKGQYDEVWRIRQTMIDSESDIFDLCWYGNERLVTGGHDCIKIWNVEDKKSFCACYLLEVFQTVHYSEGFVKGVCSHSNRFLAAQSNEKRAVVWAKTSVHLSDTKSSELQPVIDESELFSKGPSDLPYSRRGSFDPAGRVVAFPNGQKASQHFGVAYYLNRLHNGFIQQGFSPTPFRFRGHIQRVNCVCFSRGVWTSFDSDASTSPDIISDMQFTLYAQASTDGALSVWKFFYPPISLTSRSQQQLVSDQDESNTQQHLTAKCFLVLKPRLFDEQASVTDMTWSPDGLSLAIAADDGSITLIIFSQQELHGQSLPNPKPWNRVTNWPTPPRHPDAQLEIPLVTARPLPITIESRTQSLLQSQQPSPFGVGSASEVVNQQSTTVATIQNAKRRIAPTLISSSITMGSGGTG